MRNSVPFFFAAVLVVMAQATDARADLSKEEEVKHLIQRYGQVEAQLDRSIAFTWSDDSTNFVQWWSDKRADTACVAEQIAPEPKLGGVIDLLKVLEAKTSAFLKKRADDEAGLQIDIQRVGNDGRIELSVSASISSGERKGDMLFSLAELVQLRKTAAGLRAQVLNIRRLPIER